MQFKDCCPVTQANYAHAIVDAMQEMIDLDGILVFNSAQECIAASDGAVEFFEFGDQLIGKTIADIWASDRMTAAEHNKYFESVGGANNDHSKDPVRQMAQGLAVEVMTAAGKKSIEISFAPLSLLSKRSGTCRLAGFRAPTKARKKISGCPMH